MPYQRHQYGSLDLDAFSVEEMMRRAVQLLEAMILGVLLVGLLPADALQLAKVEVLSRSARPAMGRAFPRRKRASVVVWAVTLLALLVALAAPIPASEAPKAEHHSYSAGSRHDQSVGAAAPVSQPAAPQMSEQEALDAYGKLPLSFIPNEGQTDEAVRYYAQGAGYGFFFTSKGATLSFADGKGRGHALALDFLGTDSHATLTARQRLSGKVNYLVGDDPTKWQQELPTHAELLYGGL